VLDSLGLKSVQQLTEALPGVEGTVRDAIAGIQVLVKETLVPIIADVVSETLARVDALDGAKITIAPSGKLTATISITVDIPTFTAAVSMPLKRQTFNAEATA
jgi:hypothetical protein